MTETNAEISITAASFSGAVFYIPFPENSWQLPLGRLFGAVS